MDHSFRLRKLQLLILPIRVAEGGKQLVSRWMKKKYISMQHGLRKSIRKPSSCYFGIDDPCTPRIPECAAQSADIYATFSHIPRVRPSVISGCRARESRDRRRIKYIRYK